MDEQKNAPKLRSGERGKSTEKIAEINREFKERDIKTRAKKEGTKYIDLKNSPINHDAIQLTTWSEVEKRQAVPFEIAGRTLHVACVDPQSGPAQELINRLIQQGYQVESYVCSPEGIQSVKRYFDQVMRQEPIVLQKTVEEGNIPTDWKALLNEKKKVYEKASGPEMMNTLNLQATQFKASDIHFQPEEDQVVMRMRRDGLLYEVLSISNKQFQMLSSEIKRAAGIKINIQQTPQDGEYQYEVNNRRIGVRVSTLPTQYGESIVLRILDAQNAMVDINQLGFTDYQKTLIVDQLKKETGLILVTGPTGSGKTSTLYSCIHAINTPEKKIITLEDPIEFEIHNVTQSEIVEEEGYTFAMGLRHVLRQDPNVIMVGEIRDKDAAEIAFQAALTGHMVLSTVHSNDAVLTIPRLLNIGVKPYILALGLEMVIAQRLVRRLCQSCRTPAQISEAERADIDQVKASLASKGITIPEEQIFNAKGCDECHGEGYNGRMVMAEILKINEAIRRSVLAGESAEQIVAIAEKEGYIRIKEDGVLKVLQGLTTLQEVWKGLV
ncbi:MAG: GspE/PulE family protein [bacterium]|nr:GspE/PulE family protein [bacterium]